MTYAMVCEECGNYGEHESESFSEQMVKLHNKQFHAGEDVAEVQEVAEA